MSVEHIFDVRHIKNLGDKFSINLKEFTCFCRKWKITTSSCVHAVVSIKSKNLKFDEYILKDIQKVQVSRSYLPIIYPINGSNMWVKNNTLMFNNHSIKII